MPHGYDILVSNLIAFGKSVSQKKLIWANSGNISHKLSNNSFIISGHGAILENLKKDNFMEVFLDGNVLSGIAQPSLETKIHVAVYNKLPRVNAVFHSQAFFTTLISSTDLEIDNNLFPESMAYIKNICRISYHHPGSSDLAEEVSEKIPDCDILILNNHGALCASDSLESVLLKTETLEMLCKMIIFSKISEINLNFLPDDLKEDFLNHLKQIKDSK
jgi:L-fuculose-phosphate aldolase